MLAGTRAGTAVLDEFLAADVDVLASAFQDQGAASQLKAQLDRIAVTGKTVRYTARGVEGMAGDKRAVITVVRGDSNCAGAPEARFEHAASYPRSVFAFAGIIGIDVICAHAPAVSDEKRAAGIRLARSDSDNLTVN